MNEPQRGYDKPVCWLAEAMPVFERSYLKNNSYEPHSDTIFEVYAFKSIGFPMNSLNSKYGVAGNSHYR
jgi:hypothetical protein